MGTQNKTEYTEKEIYSAIAGLKNNNPKAFESLSAIIELLASHSKDKQKEIYSIIAGLKNNNPKAYESLCAILNQVLTCSEMNTI